jgi:DNA-binding response OmpR family regulator
MLSAREFGVVWMLASYLGRSVATSELARAVLGNDSQKACAHMHVLVIGLRRKLRALGDAATIATVAGGGYALVIRG